MKALRAPRLLPLSDPRARDRDVAGGKAATLAELLASGFAVPEGMVLPAGASFDARAAEALWQEAAPLRTGGAALAVRSSARVEDSAEQSFAGQFLTVLDVGDASALASAVLACRASYAKCGPGTEAAEAAPTDEPVFIQRQIAARWAGVCFTADPASGIEQLTVVEAVPGPGEALVSGRAEPAYLRLDRRGGRVVELRGVEAGTAEGQKLLGLLRDVAALGERVGQTLRNGTPPTPPHTKGGSTTAARAPLDLEWAFDGECLWLLQARPVTTPTFGLPDREPLTEPEVWYHGNFAETMPGPVPLLAWDIIAESMRHLFPFSAGRVARSARGDVIECLAGRVCWNVSLQAYLGLLNRGNLRTMGLIEARMVAALERLHEAGQIARVRSPPARDRARLWAVAGQVGARVLWRMARSGRLGRERALGEVSAAVTRLLAGTEAEACRQLNAAEAWRRARRLIDEFVPVLLPHLGIMAWPVVTLVWARLAARWSGWTVAEVATACLDTAPTWARRMDSGLRALGEELRAQGVAAAREKLAAFLAEFGFRGPREQDLSAPRFAEQPELVIELALRAAESPAFRPDAAQDGVERLFAAVAARGPLGRVRAAILRRGWRTAREWAPLREDAKHVFWMPIMARLRALVLRAGEDLHSRGVLERPEDVFHFSCAELDALCCGADLQVCAAVVAVPAPGAGKGEALGNPQAAAQAKELAAARRGELERWRRLDFPEVLRSDGVPVTFAAQGEAGVWRGVGVSAGVHEGPARVARTFEEARAVESGEVLVVSAVDPGWAPVLARAGALVMEIGGVLSHACVIARELRLPAVAGIHRAARTFRTGQRLRVDGRTGEVREVREVRGPA
jgi:pyruvate,water dikinase